MLGLGSCFGGAERAKIPAQAAAGAAASTAASGGGGAAGDGGGLATEVCAPCESPTNVMAAMSQMARDNQAALAAILTAQQGVARAKLPPTAELEQLKFDLEPTGIRHYIANIELLAYNHNISALHALNTDDATYAREVMDSESATARGDRWAASVINATLDASKPKVLVFTKMLNRSGRALDVKGSGRVMMRYVRHKAAFLNGTSEEEFREKFDATRHFAIGMTQEQVLTAGNQVLDELFLIEAYSGIRNVEVRSLVKRMPDVLPEKRTYLNEISKHELLGWPAPYDADTMIQMIAIAISSFSPPCVNAAGMWANGEHGGAKPGPPAPPWAQRHASKGCTVCGGRDHVNSKDTKCSAKCDTCGSGFCVGTYKKGECTIHGDKRPTEAWPNALGAGPVPAFVLTMAQKLWDERSAKKAASTPSVSAAASQTAPMTVANALAAMPAGASHQGGGYFFVPGL